MDKKGSIYSDRPLNKVPQFITKGDHLTLEQQGPAWRMKRSVVTQYFNPKLLDEKHYKIQEAEYVVGHPASICMTDRTDIKGCCFYEQLVEATRQDVPFH